MAGGQRQVTKGARVTVPPTGHLSPSRRLLQPRAGAVAGSPFTPSKIPDVPPCLLSRQQHSLVGVEKVRRLALMVTPESEGEFLDQAWEALSTIRAILRQQGEPMSVTAQTVLAASNDRAPTEVRNFAKTLAQYSARRAK